MIVYIISVIFITLIINYVRLKSRLIIHNPINIQKDSNELSILTFNTQRLPYLLTRPYVDIKNLIKQYDFICLQENFCFIMGYNHHDDINCIIPSGHVFKILNSGLSIYSKYKMEYIGFVRFNNLKSVDKLSDKGFMIVKIKDLYIINTHLQANYSSNVKSITAINQLKLIFKHCKKFKKVLICGDFNLDIRTLKIPGIYKKVIPNKPTHWCKQDTILNISSAEKNLDMKPFYFDGAIYKNINTSNIEVNKIDDCSDHLGVSFQTNF